MDTVKLMYLQLESNTFIYKKHRNTKNILAVKIYMF